MHSAQHNCFLTDYSYSYKDTPLKEQKKQSHQLLKVSHNHSPSKSLQLNAQENGKKKGMVFWDGSLYSVAYKLQDISAVLTRHSSNTEGGQKALSHGESLEVSDRNSSRVVTVCFLIYSDS